MLHWLPQNISTYGQSIDDVMRLIYYIVGAWFILAEAVLLYFVIRYRRRDGGHAGYAPGNTARALAWILVPAALILACDLGIDYAQEDVWNEIKLHIPTDVKQTVRIEGQQFVWNFRHPGKDGKLDTADDIVLINQLTVPVNEKIRFELSSKDVLHSFWVPELRLKQDAVPGRIINGWFAATKTGTYTIGCAELCGSGHTTMKAQLHVLNPADYAQWLADNSPESEEP